MKNRITFLCSCFTQRSRPIPACLILLGSFCLSGLAADPGDPYSHELTKRIQPLVDAHRGDVGLAIRNLEGPGEYDHRGDSAMATASLIKLPLMVATYQKIDSGDLDPQTKIVLREDDKVPGSGILTEHFSAGLTISLVDAIRLMIRYSDNTATNLVADQAGLDATAKSMEQLGLPETKLHSKVYRGDTTIFPARSKRFGLGSTAANEMVRLLEKLHRREVASKESCDAMIKHLLTCDDHVKIRAGLPPGTKLAHKTGAVSRSRTDAGIVYGPKPGQAFAICVLTGNNEDRGWNDDSEPHRLIAKIAGEAFDVFYGDMSEPRVDESKPLQSGAFGKLVEAVQRTLNKRMKPSPALSVDGDFGPMTKAAVIRFQEANGLPSDGIMDEKTFAALGTLIENDDAVPPPAKINNNWPEKRSRDPLGGVPFVTAKAWVIVDAKSGE
ncbi:MAG: serine hydrolase, partial [Planctomycetota bacterium]